MVAWDDVKSSGQAVPSAQWNLIVDKIKSKAPLASPTFTGTATMGAGVPAITISDYRTLDAAGVSVPTTSPAVVDQVQTANGINYDYVKFEKNVGSTTVGIEFMQWNMKMPDDWNEGTIVADVDWLELTGDTTGRAAFILRCRRYLNADINAALAAGCTFDNASNVSGGAGFVSKTVAPSAFAITGAGNVGKWCVFELTRVTPAAGTDVNAPVRVLGINLKITRTLA